MTREEKRDLLSRLACKVMGWRPAKGRQPKKAGEFVVSDNAKCVVYHNGSFVHYWTPTEYVGDAWMLIDAVSARTKWWELSRRPSGVCANFIGDPKANHYGADVCEAICLAADAFAADEAAK